MKMMKNEITRCGAGRGRNSMNREKKHLEQAEGFQELKRKERVGNKISDENLGCEMVQETLTKMLFR